MKIACIGWGSLVWRPEGLKIQDKWYEDGPLLQIELTRQSDDDRITLIIDTDKETKFVRTLWTLMTTENLDDAKRSLKVREGTRDEYIHSILTNEATHDQVKVIIKNWLEAKGLDAAIWTGLSYSKRTSRSRPSIDYVINHLKGLDSEKKKVAEEYIRKAPKQIDTLYRRGIELELGWSSVE
jgi:hypothetical protein